MPFSTPENAASDYDARMHAPLLDDGAELPRDLGGAIKRLRDSKSFWLAYLAALADSK